MTDTMQRYYFFIFGQGLREEGFIFMVNKRYDKSKDYLLYIIEL